MEHLCNKEGRISILETRICRVEKDYKEQNDKIMQLDKTLDRHAEINVRIETKLDRIDDTLKELKEEKKQSKNFWKDKSVGVIIAILQGIIILFLAVKFGLK